MLEGYAASQAIIEKLNKAYPIYLLAGKQKIKLIVVSKHKGLYDLTQVILKPEKELNAKRKYYLKIDNLDSTHNK